MAAGLKPFTISQTAITISCKKMGKLMAPITGDTVEREAEHDQEGGGEMQDNRDQAPDG